MPSTAPAPQEPLIEALRNVESYPHLVASIQVIETHISWVILTGTYAYKIKKPVDLGFANFSTLELRHRNCEEELRLNQRLAPELYLEVVPICGGAEGARIGGVGTVLDYAVKMKEFSQDALASRLLAAGKFGSAQVDDLARLIAEFHLRAPAVPANGDLGTPQTVLASALQNFDQMSSLLNGSADAGDLSKLREWTQREYALHVAHFALRRAGGSVRECHGDLHLGNIALLDMHPVPFDCIEFNEQLRCIDVINEVAFLLMDFEDRGHADLGWRFVNHYLEQTGDYEALALLRFYAVYRALVRAKVHLMRSQQAGVGQGEAMRLHCAWHGYLRLARGYAAPSHPALFLTHGLSGSGKTSATQSLVEGLGAIRLRSDLERKRMQGIAPLAASGSDVGGGIYTREATAATYRRLGELAQATLRAGLSVVVDATFLKRADREAFRAIAEQCDVPMRILDFHAPLEVLRARVAARRARADDASEADVAVLERQVAAREPLTPTEMAEAVVIDGTRTASVETWRPLWKRMKS